MSVHIEGWSEEIYKKEEVEWERINKLLKHNGIKPVSFIRASESRNMSDMVLLDMQTLQDIKYALKTLVEDSERRQKMIEGLIHTNAQLRNDIQQQQGRASRQEKRAVDLELILESVKSKVRELEDDFIAKACQQQTQMKELQKDKQATESQYYQQKQQLLEKEEKIAHLKEKLHMLVKGEEQRLARQSKVFRQFHKRAPRHKSALDEPLLEVIDSYERQVYHLQKELRRYEDNVGGTEGKGKDKDPLLNLDATPNYKALLKSYQDQLREWKTKSEQFLCENGNLIKELETRPSAKELKMCKQQMKRLEKILLQNNIKYSTSGLVSGEKADEKKELESTRVDDIDLLKAKLCRSYLQDVCNALDVQDLKDLVSVASKRTKQAEASLSYSKVLASINSVLSGPGAPQLLYKQRSRSHLNWSTDKVQESEFEHLLPTVMMWADQLRSLKALHGSLKTLALRLGQLPVDNAHEDFRVEDLLLFVDTIFEELDNKEQDKKGPSFQTLESFVLHFQKLFDVTSLNGIYPRLNEVYSKLGEMNNAMRTMCELLGLDESAPASVLVNVVGRLCGVIKERTDRQVQQLLGNVDINSIIRQLEDYEEFFPAFETLIQELLQILEINNLDDILPTVQTLKMVKAKE